MHGTLKIWDLWIAARPKIVPSLFFITYFLIRTLSNPYIYYHHSIRNDAYTCSFQFFFIKKINIQKSVVSEVKLIVIRWNISSEVTHKREAGYFVPFYHFVISLCFLFLFRIKTCVKLSDTYDESFTGTVHRMNGTKCVFLLFTLYRRSIFALMQKATPRKSPSFEIFVIGIIISTRD